MITAQLNDALCIIGNSVFFDKTVTRELAVCGHIIYTHNSILRSARFSHIMGWMFFFRWQ